jgi:GT2 family glycosyltransferase
MVNNGDMDVVPTCNAACLRAAFEKIGGFNEEFLFLNEDADLAWRLESLGKICYAPDALVVHPPRPETFTKKVQWVRHLDSEFLLFARNPVAYRKHRSRNPWLFICWNIFVVSQLRQIRAAAVDLLVRGRPDHCAIRLALIVVRAWHSICLFPRLRYASRLHAGSEKSAPCPPAKA